MTTSLSVSLTPKQGSEFKRVTVKFTTKKSKELVFRVVSDLTKTAQWITEVSTIIPLKTYSNNHFLLRTVLDSPWPFLQRELITCVSTKFDPKSTIIDVVSCSQRHPLDSQYVRVSQLQSRWMINQVNQEYVEVNYQTWLDPKGFVPAFFFNRALESSTTASFKRLQQLIENAH